MTDAITKAQGLIEALGYIQRFHDKTVVVKIGGSIMDDADALTNILTDIVFMNYVGMQPVLVHGGGKAINEAMEKAGLTFAGEFHFEADMLHGWIEEAERRAVKYSVTRAEFLR